MTSQPNTPFVINPSEGTAFWQARGLFMTKADGATTGGSMTGWEVIAPRGESPPRHVHRDEDEVWFVLDGQLTFELDGVCREAVTGALVWAPRGHAHTFRVDSETARMLILALPAGLERFFAEVGHPATSRTLPPPHLPVPDEPFLAAQSAKAGIKIVGPPLAAPSTALAAIPPTLETQP